MANKVKYTTHEIDVDSIKEMPDSQLLDAVDVLTLVLTRVQKEIFNRINTQKEVFNMACGTKKTTTKKTTKPATTKKK